MPDDHGQVAVLGAGSWGTALAVHLGRSGRKVRLWGHDAQHVARLQAARCNERYLPGTAFPDEVQVAGTLPEALAGCRLLLTAVPSHALAGTLRACAPHVPAGAGLLNATKGLEPGTGRWLHEVAASVLPDCPYAVVSGPSFARELARGLPTAVTVAGDDPEHVHRAALALHHGPMRVYTGDDVRGVAWGGAYKNVLAIAVGIADGLALGANARAALITRGLAEMVRLGVALGGRRETFMGLSGVGDLVLTCTDDQSRNRRFGLALGRGGTPEAAKAAIGQVVEGAHAVHEVMRLAEMMAIELPIAGQVCAILDGRITADAALLALLGRDRKTEGG